MHDKALIEAKAKGIDVEAALERPWARVITPSILGSALAIGLFLLGYYTAVAFFPIFFELTVLFSAFTTVFSIMVFNRLPQWYHPLFNWERFKRVTDDGFFLVVEARDPKFNEEKTRALLEEIGGQHVTLIHD